MTEDRPWTVGQAMEHAVGLVRAGDYAAAIPLLERIDRTGQSPHARMIIDFARFRLAGHTVAPVACHGHTLLFEIAGDNVGHDMFHVSGRLFEAAELDYCRSNIPVGSRIVDVGANTGNHSVFFGHVLKPSFLLPIEPNPQAVARLKANLARNRVDHNPRGLGIAVGAARAMAALEPGAGDLVAGRLRPNGSIPVLPLDDLLDAPVDFLKIDVEGIEFSVLAGAQTLLRTGRPQMLIETADRTADRLKQFCQDHGYRIDREFPGYGYRNYFLKPA